MFSDKDGFNVAQVEVPIRAMSSKSDNGAKYTGLSANANAYMDVEYYRHAASWNPKWVGFAAPKADAAGPWDNYKTPPVARPPPDVPKWKDIALWRKLDRKMSKQQVRQLLGEPTRIEEGGALVFWTYGYPSGGYISFSVDDGSIYSFREPAPTN